jgi:(p)ppGpp synthase/HD superfamily hydrolase
MSNLSKFKKEMHHRLLMDSGMICPKVSFITELNAVRSAGGPDVVDASLFSLEETCKSHIKSHAVLFNHPLRVATILLQYEPQYSADLIALALLHNTIEKSLFSEIELEKIANKQVASGVAFLSKIRGSEKNTIEILEFYREVGLEDNGMRAKVKIADKLDNIYMLCFNPDTQVREKYLQEIEAFVLPLAEKFSPYVLDEFKAACVAQRQVGYLDKNQETIAARKVLHEN